MNRSYFLSSENSAFEHAQNTDSDNLVHAQSINKAFDIL